MFHVARQQFKALQILERAGVNKCMCFKCLTLGLFFLLGVCALCFCRDFACSYESLKQDSLKINEGSYITQRFGSVCVLQVLKAMLLSAVCFGSAGDASPKNRSTSTVCLKLETAL